MAHRCKVDGTNYNIISGRCKVDGTNYKIIGGRTKVDGTSYAISFGKLLTTRGIQNVDNGAYHSLVYLNSNEIDNGTYSFSDSDTIKIYTYSATANSQQIIKLNGVQVKKGSGIYTISNPSQYNSILIELILWTSGSVRYWECQITTT